MIKFVNFYKFSFMLELEANDIPDPVTEYFFWSGRKFRFDYAWPAYRIALEVEGGVWTKGRHVRGKGFLKDMEKYNEAALRGWLLLRVTPEGLDSGETMDLLKRAIKERTPWKNQKSGSS